MELTQKEAYEPSLEEVYEKWQSQPNTVELWGEMSEEIRRAMAKELENFGMPKEDNPSCYEKQSRVNKSPKKEQRSVKTTTIVISDDVECTCNPVKTAPNKQVIVISDDESDDEDDENEKEKQEWVRERAREKRKQERALEKYGITFEQYYNLI
jgi:hypothetical protein